MCASFLGDRFWNGSPYAIGPMSCPSCLSVTLVYCGQTVGWIKMKLGTEVGLGSGHTVLDGDPAQPQKGAQPPIFRPYLLWSNGWMDQDASWYGGRLQPRWHCVRWGPSPPGRGIATPFFSAHIYCGQTVAYLSYCWALVYFPFTWSHTYRSTHNQATHLGLWLRQPPVQDQYPNVPNQD